MARLNQESSPGRGIIPKLFLTNNELFIRRKPRLEADIYGTVKVRACDLEFDFPKIVFIQQVGRILEALEVIPNKLGVLSFVLAKNNLDFVLEVWSYR